LENSLKRRQFLTSSLAASAFALAAKTSGAESTSAETPREYYELRQYHMQADPKRSGQMPMYQTL